MNDSNAPILKNLPVLPLKRTVLFPGTMMPLTVGRDRSIAAVEAALKTEDKTLLVVAQRDAQIDQPLLEDLYTIGTKAVMTSMPTGMVPAMRSVVMGAPPR